MKRSLMAVMVTAVMGLGLAGSQQAEASDWWYDILAARRHAAHHADLEHRAFHRELAHREAHRHPMTWRQHEGLHDALEHEAFHDALEHRAAHRGGAYYRPPVCRPVPVSPGIGIRGRGFSLWFGF